MFLNHKNKELIDVYSLFRRSAYLSSFYYLQSFSEDEEEEIENIPPYNYIMRGFPANCVGDIIDLFRVSLNHGADFYDIWSRILDIIYCDEDIDLFIKVYKDILIRYKKKRPLFQGVCRLIKYYINVFHIILRRIYLLK